MFMLGGEDQTCLGHEQKEEPGKEDSRLTSRATAVENGKPAGAIAEIVKAIRIGAIGMKGAASPEVKRGR